MKSIITTYPNFQQLPNSIKTMVLVSESLFWEESNAARPNIVAEFKPEYPSTLKKTWRNQPFFFRERFA